jgi:hypothetical protein
VGVLLILSFAAYPAWPGDYLHSLQLSETTLHVTAMPNLRSLLFGMPGALAMQILGTAAGAVLCWPVMQVCWAVGFSICPVLLNFEGARFVPQVALIGLFLWMVLGSRSLRPAQRYELERE